MAGNPPNRVGGTPREGLAGLVRARARHLPGGRVICLSCRMGHKIVSSLDGGREGISANWEILSCTPPMDNADCMHCPAGVLGGKLNSVLIVSTILVPTKST